jgi:sporulation protein YlmC with PRC-barrel domain
MTLSDKIIVGLPVFTENNTKIGKVFEIELNEKEHLVEKYLIKTQKLFSLVNEILLISPQQVLSINNERMVVEDAIVKNLVISNKKKNASLEDASTATY